MTATRRLHAGFVVVAGLIWITPVIWMFSLSLTPNSVLQTTTTSLVPIQPTLDNFADVFRVGLTARWFWNSVVVTTVTTAATLLLSAMCGYAFARIPFRGKRLASPSGAETQELLERLESIESNPLVRAERGFRASFTVAFQQCTPRERLLLPWVRETTSQR